MPPEVRAQITRNLIGERARFGPNVRIDIARIQGPELTEAERSRRVALQSAKDALVYDFVPTLPLLTRLAFSHVIEDGPLDKVWNLEGLGEILQEKLGGDALGSFVDRIHETYPADPKVYAQRLSRFYPEGEVPQLSTVRIEANQLLTQWSESLMPKNVEAETYVIPWPKAA